MALKPNLIKGKVKNSESQPTTFSRRQLLRKCRFCGKTCRFVLFVRRKWLVADAQNLFLGEKQRHFSVTREKLRIDSAPGFIPDKDQDQETFSGLIRTLLEGCQTGKKKLKINCRNVACLIVILLYLIGKLKGLLSKHHLGMLSVYQQNCFLKNFKC